MQAKSSVSDYREFGELRWMAVQPNAAPGIEKPKLVVVKTKQGKLKPGLY